MTERETERLLEILKEMNRNWERGLEKINNSLEKISDELRDLR